MPKFRLDTKKITYYTVVIEAETLEQAEAEVAEWSEVEFEPHANAYAEWVDGEWEEVDE